MLNTQSKELLDRIKGNDQFALKQLFQQHYAGVAQAIYRLVKERNLAEDLAQNVFIRFWEKREQLQVNSSLKAYLHRMAVNEALAHLRKIHRLDPREEVPDTATETSGEDQFLQEELKDHIRAAIDTLPPRCRLIFQLSRFEELTYKEIAEKLEVSIKTVENQMGKALRLLRERLHGYLESS
jgi:RNA polymerase sigma-70 factor (ECF subfamily)